MQFQLAFTGHADVERSQNTLQGYELWLTLSGLDLVFEISKLNACIFDRLKAC
jgi:hypothetical protein